MSETDAEQPVSVRELTDTSSLTYLISAPDLSKEEARLLEMSLDHRLNNAESIVVRGEIAETAELELPEEVRNEVFD